MRVEEGSQMSSGLSSMFSFFTWTNTFYILIYLTSLSDCEVSNFHSQMSSSSSQRHSEKYTTSFSEARASALQAAPPEPSPCPKGYVIDRFNNNECVKRFVSNKNFFFCKVELCWFFVYHIILTNTVISYIAFDT